MATTEDIDRVIKARAACAAACAGFNREIMSAAQQLHGALANLRGLTVQLERRSPRRAQRTMKRQSGR